MPKLTREVVRNNIQSSRDGGNLKLPNRQISSLQGLAEFIQRSDNLVLLDFSFNMIREISTDLVELKGLLFLDLSTNLLQKIQGIETLASLQVLRLSRNRITKIENLQNNVNLVALDVSMNQISRIENLENLPKLKIFYIYGNNLTVLENINHLNQLRELRIEQNQIVDLNHLSQFDTQIEHIEAHTNNISNLDDILVTLSHLPKLNYLSLYKNPVAQDPTYKFRVLSYKNIQTLDGLLVKDYIHEVLEDMHEDYTLDELVVKTQTAFRDLINQERSVKDMAVGLLKKQVNQLETDFIEFTRSMEDEMEDLNEFVAVLRNKKSLGEDISQDRQKLMEWRRKIGQHEAERHESIRQRMLQLQIEREEYLKDQRAQIDFTGKLYEIAQSNPQMWKDIKNQMYREQAQEQNWGANRGGFIEAIQTEIGPKHMPVTSQQAVARVGMTDVAEGLGGQLGDDTQARLDQARNAAATAIQRQARTKSKACLIY